MARTTTIGSLWRLARAGYVLMREGVVRAAAPPDPPPLGRLALAISKVVERKDSATAERDRGSRISRALNRLGPSYVKLGQFLATRPDVVGDAVARDLEHLQDRLPAFDLERARVLIAEALGKPVDDLYLQLDPALSAASIAQVHKAIVEGPDGEHKVMAVKVLRPDVEARFLRDLDAFYVAARLFERFVPSAERLRPLAIVDTLARSVRLEMDLRLEAAALSEMAENIKGDPGFRVPSVDWERTAKTVLTLEWIDGRKLTDMDGLLADGIDPVALGRNVIQSFLRHAMRDGFFHADMHPGNLFVEPDGTLVAVDFGIMGRISKDERRFLAEILFGFIRRNYRRVSEVHFEAGYVPPTQEIDVFAQALRAIGEPLHGRSAAQISMAHLLKQLFDYTDLFEMRTQPRLIMLQKTMVVVEGVARNLDPDLNMWTTAEPVVREWIEKNLGPAGKLSEAAEGVGSLARLVSQMPVVAERAERVSADFARMAEEGLRLDPATVESLARAQARRAVWTRAAVWVAAAALVAMAVGW